MNTVPVPLPLSESASTVLPPHVPWQVSTTLSSASSLDTSPSCNFPSSPKLFEQDFDSQQAPESHSTLQVPKQSNSPLSSNLPTFPTFVPPSSKYPPCPNLIYRLEMSSGSTSDSKGIGDPFISRLFSGSNSKHSAKHQTGYQIVKKHAKTTHIMPNDQIGRVPRYQENSSLSCLHGYTSPFWQIWFVILPIYALFM